MPLVYTILDHNHLPRDNKLRIKANLPFVVPKKISTFARIYATPQPFDKNLNYCQRELVKWEP